LYTGAFYHLAFFSRINTAAYVFGTVFILQGIFFLVETFKRKKVEFSLHGSFRGYLGYFLILFGLVIYPLIHFMIERSWVETISLGLPCPSTIFTFGFLLLTDRKMSKYLLIIPSLWAVAGLSAAVNFGVYQDFMMMAAAIIANVTLIGRKK
jgi:hypothetical protein